MSICAVRAHDILLNRLLNSDRLDSLVKSGELRPPVGWWDDFNNAALHSVGVYFVHLQRGYISDRAYRPAKAGKPT